MRILKLALISAVVFAIILTGFSLLLPSTINISKAIDINAAPSAIYPNLADFSKWKHWYADSSPAKISDPSIGKGATMHTGRTTITVLSANEKTINLNWETGNNAMTGAFNIYSDSANIITTVQWHFIQKVKWYPWEKFASIVSNKAVGPFMEKSLDNLKKHIEDNR